MKAQHDIEIVKLRVDTTTLQLLEQARGLLHLDKSKFIRQCVREKALAIIAEHEQTRFTANDWQAFFDLVENAPAPSERLKKAAANYHAITRADEV